MKTWTSAGAVLFFCSIAAGQPSMYNITVKIAGGSIAYDHVMGTHGMNGHQIAAQNDIINWACDSTCTLIAITFKGSSPCSSSGLSCTVNFSGTGIFPYSVAVVDSKGYPVVGDPDVIVDNSGSKPGGQQKRGTVRPAPKKQ